MVSTFTDGIAHIRDMAARRVDIGAGNCKLRTREAFGVPSNGTASAAASWVSAPDKHRDPIPEKAPAFSFGWMTGGGHGFGHVVVNLGGGRILTPGGPDAPARWYETTAAELLAKWSNLRWVGWTRTIDGRAPAQPPKPKPVPPARVVLDHRSGRFDRPADLLLAAVTDSAREGADVVNVTEVNEKPRGDALKKVPGFDVGRTPGPNNHGESAVLFRDNVWTRVVGDTVTIGPDPGPGGATVARLELLRHNKTGVLLLTAVAHFPSAVEGTWAKRTRTVVAHQAAVQRLRREVRRWYRKHMADAVVVTADWNLNLHKPWVRAWIKTAWPGLKPVPTLPKGGTHAGGRLIDWPITRGVSGRRLEILPATTASDHRGIRLTGNIRKAKR